MKKETLKIEGMHCASCALNIEKGVKKLDGVEKSTVNYATGSAYLEYDNTKVSRKDISSSIDKLGYQVLDEKKGEHDHDHMDHEGDEKALRMKMIISVILTIPIFIRMFYKWSEKI